MTDIPGVATGPTRLTAVEIRNYRGYRGTFRLDLPQGENLIIFGENGSGKSSFYNSLRTFFEAPDLRVQITETGVTRFRPIAITDGANRFATDPPAIRLEFGADAFEWTNTRNDTPKQIVRLLNQGKGFLDYKALLDIHYLREGDDRGLDLFQLIIRRLLPYYTYPAERGTVTFQAGWRSLTSNVTRRWRAAAGERFRKDLALFNDALERTVHDLATRATAMMSSFGDGFAVDFGFERAEFRTGPKRIVGPRLLVKPAYRNLEIADYHDFFNEAKLSALAICIFFAALKNSPATGLRILALDDVLIGLDMSNRAKVLDLIHEHFSEWQILILTYSKAWFESLKDKVKTLTWSANWLSIVLWEEEAADGSPRIVAEGSGDLIEMAERHLQRKDFTAAAVYARKALEFCCHKTCAKASLKVVHVESAKDRQLQDFFDVLRPRIAEFADAVKREHIKELFIRLERAKAFVLNPNAHFDVQEEDVLSVEVSAGLQAVKEFVQFADAQSWKKTEFQSGLVMSETDELRWKLSEARGRLLVGEIDHAQSLMKDAHTIFWLFYGRRLGVALPMGSDAKPWTIWKAAVAQGKLSNTTEARLKASRPYLSGAVGAEKFVAADFEGAAVLLEQLSAPLLLPPKKAE